MNEQIGLRAITWNVGQSKPPEDLTELLATNKEKLPDVFAIGLQGLGIEPIALIESHHRDNWTRTITGLLSEKDYIMVNGFRMYGIHLMVYVKREHLMSISNVGTDFVMTGVWPKCKGAVGIKLTYGKTGLCFVNAHLTGGADNLDQRIEDLRSVLGSMRFKDIERSIITDQDCAILMGDLNFRVLVPDVIDKDAMVAAIGRGEHKRLVILDEGSVDKVKEECHGFKEGDISFAPTYKFVVGKDQYDTTKVDCLPSWCDRILWFESANVVVEQHEYNSLAQYSNSKHRPVVSSFTIKTEAVDIPSMKVNFVTEKRRWCRGRDQKLKYSVPKDFLSHSSDLLGLYPVRFSSIDDRSVAFWISSCGKDNNDGTYLYKSCIKKEDLGRVPNGKYVLCYFSHVCHWVVGQSDEIEVVDLDLAPSAEDVQIVDEPRAATSGEGDSVMEMDSRVSSQLSIPAFGAQAAGGGDPSNEQSDAQEGVFSQIPANPQAQHAFDDALDEDDEHEWEYLEVVKEYVCLEEDYDDDDDDDDDDDEDNQYVDYDTYEGR